MAIQKVAFNVDKRMYLRKAYGAWYLTNENTAAYAASDEKLRKAIVDVGAQVPGRWEIVRAADVSKMYPRHDPVIHIPMSAYGAQRVEATTSVAFTTPRNDGCEKILSAVRSLSELISEESMKDIAQRQSAADRLITDIYHNIEVSNYNAAQGYKAYRMLKEALISRRKIKNEYTIALKLRQSCLSDIARFEELSSKAWEPNVDIFLEEKTDV